MLKFNKGEWSEPYCLLKTMVDKKLFLCNENLSNTGKHIKVIGGNLSENISYIICDEVIKFSTGEITKEYSQLYIKNLASQILVEIKKNQPRTFPIPDLESFFMEIGNPSIKSKSLSKSDCKMTVFDDYVQSNEELGFSIKSFLAGSPTLINASQATNFIYEVNTNNHILNDLKAKRLVKDLNNHDALINYKGMNSDIYLKNLMLIDTQMPLLVSEILKIYFGSKIKSIENLVNELQKSNPLHIDDGSLYRSKITDFLFYSATGMFPNRKWKGIQDVNGGYLVVDKNGDVLTFYIFRKKFLIKFREYLYKNCFLDTASTTRHGFGSLYSEDDHCYLKLNLQVRIMDR